MTDRLGWLSVSVIIAENRLAVYRKGWISSHANGLVRPMALEYDFENSIGFWLITGSQAYQRAVNDELAPQGITYRQCQVLALLSLLGPISQAELAQKMEVEPPTLVGILDRMERDGWIRREACPEDRRRKLVHPTKAAEPVWNRITATARRVRQRATKGLTAAQLGQLKEMLEIVRHNLETNAAATENNG